MPRVVDHSPSPKSHIKTLMRIGYTLNSAAADIIDNSITANAKNIEVYAPPGLDNPLISILDDGCGMDQDELVENMRIGCKDPSEEREQGDLGRFGSGLKTASFSQARQLTVISRKAGQPLAAARWDIDQIEKTDSWCLEVFDEEEAGQLSGFNPKLMEDHGTQIIWGKLACIDSGSHAQDKDSELAAKLSDLKSYLALHFHRFIGGKARSFFLNGSLIEPIDPFMQGVSGYQEGPSTRSRCKGGFIYIKTHVLPHFRRLDPEQLEKLGGADGIAEKQGLYIYREKRLISAGGWLGISRSTQLGALARVQVDIPSALDNDWSTDVKKASLQIPLKVKRELRKYLADPVRRSRRVHTHRSASEEANGFWNICEDENTGVITYQINPQNVQLASLLKNCRKEDGNRILKYLGGLATALPINHIYEKMSDRPRDVRQEDVDMEALEALLNKVFEN